MNDTVEKCYKDWGGITPMQITTISEDPEDLDVNGLADHSADFILMKELGIDSAVREGLQELQAELIKDHGYPSDFKIDLTEQEIFSAFKGVYNE